ncbi:MAG: 1-deoxy-D-xylulose-5-phosphate synthase [Verrucomicrobia bacterium]|nr:1-deoxy-D-xylulose-5-phosphate synthase [Verrucomicrobiota bacterium]
MLIARMKTRIMYIERKGGKMTGPGRIGRVSFSKTGQTIYYRGKTFKRLRAAGAGKANYHDVETGEEYWISGCRRDGGDRLYGGRPIEIDADVRREYATDIRGMPECSNRKTV